jgi:hypothetical protein
MRRLRLRNAAATLPIFRNDAFADVAAENPDRHMERDRRESAQLLHLPAAPLAATPWRDVLSTCIRGNSRADGCHDLNTALIRGDWVQTAMLRIEPGGLD